MVLKKLASNSVVLFHRKTILLIQKKIKKCFNRVGFGGVSAIAPELVKKRSPSAKIKIQASKIDRCSHSKTASMRFGWLGEMRFTLSHGRSVMIAIVPPKALSAVRKGSLNSRSILEL